MLLVLRSLNSDKCLATKTPRHKDKKDILSIPTFFHSSIIPFYKTYLDQRKKYPVVLGVFVPWWLLKQPFHYITFFLQRGYIYDRRNRMKGKRWDDHYTRRAKEEKWLARSVYKLQEIDNKFKLIPKGGHLLDLGCYPGSWSQYGIRKVGPGGNVTGIDLSQPDQLSFPNFRFMQADVFSLEIEALVLETGKMDVVMSDLAPKTTGIKITDVSRSIALAGRAEEIALVFLKKKGHFLCKVFEGEDLKPFKSKVSENFKQVRLYRSKATRKRSREVYLVGLGFR
jgi:23S rRNA (uridine2552-2'-O)-methyltransferase